MLLAERGHSREQFMKWDIEYIQEILFPPRDEKTKQPKFLTQTPTQTVASASESVLDQMRRSLWLAGYATEQIEKIVAQQIEGRERLLEEAGLRHRVDGIRCGGDIMP